MQSISYAFPLTRGITAGRALVNGASLTDVAPLLWGELGIGLVYGLLGYILFMMFEIVAKHRVLLKYLNLCENNENPFSLRRDFLLTGLLSR